jgi:hypothetical protein
MLRWLNVASRIRKTVKSPWRNLLPPNLCMKSTRPLQLKRKTTGLPAIQSSAHVRASATTTTAGHSRNPAMTSTGRSLMAPLVTLNGNQNLSTEIVKAVLLNVDSLLRGFSCHPLPVISFFLLFLLLFSSSHQILEADHPFLPFPSELNSVSVRKIRAIFL